jgi:hypothetical protein
METANLKELKHWKQAGTESRLPARGTGVRLEEERAREREQETLELESEKVQLRSVRDECRKW